MAPSHTILVRPATSADREGIVRVLREALGQDESRSIAYWTWKHERNPFGESPVLVALAEDEVVAVRAFLRWNWKLNGVSVHSMRAVDTATAPAWQGRGLFRQLTMRLLGIAKDEGTQFIFNTPNRASGPGYLTMGWHAIGRPVVWARLIRPSRALRAIVTRSSSDRTRELQSRPSIPFKAFSSASDPTMLYRTSEQPSGNHSLCTARTVEYLRWRYEEIPGRSYGSVSTPTKGQSNRATIVYRLCLRAGLRELRICDILCAEPAMATRAIIDLLMQLARAEAPDILTAVGSTGSPWALPLLRAGFLPVPGLGPALFVRPLGTRISHELLRRRRIWDVSAGDLEVF